VDDVVLMAENEKEVRNMMERLERYLGKKILDLKG